MTNWSAPRDRRAYRGGGSFSGLQYSKVTTRNGIFFIGFVRDDLGIRFIRRVSWAVGC